MATKTVPKKGTGFSRIAKKDLSFARREEYKCVSIYVWNIKKKKTLAKLRTTSLLLRKRLSHYMGLW